MGLAITLDQYETHSVLRLEGGIDITCAADLKRLLLEALASGKDLQLDLERVTDLDVTAIQLLWSAGFEAERSGAGVAVAGRVPEEIAFAVREAGLERFPIPTAPKV